MRIRCGVIPERSALPITSGATPETVALYRWLLTAKKHRRCIVGTNDLIWWSPATEPTPKMFGAEAMFNTVCGRWPGFLGVEYHDPAWENRYGLAATDLLRTRIQQAHARGSVIGLYNHPGNPVLGQMSRNGEPWGGDATINGKYGDRGGSPLAAIKTGGSQEAQFLAWLDRLADFCSSLVDAQGKKIPVILRPFHECGTGTWFWWNGGDRAADMIIVWRKMVDYLRVTKGLTNVLYCWNVNVQSSSNFFPWWPGAAYLDAISIDVYDNRDDSGVSLDRGGWTTTNYASLTTITSSNKPILMPELGYQYGAASISDIWDVRTGAVLANSFPQVSVAAVWTQPWGPDASQSASVKASFQRWIDSPTTLTAERMSGIYTTLL